MANIETLAADTRYFAEVAAPGTPSAGQAVIYVKSDGKIYLKNDAGTETDLTAAGSAGAQYFSRRLLAQVVNTQQTLDINLSTYLATAALIFYHDWGAFAATHFLITCHGASSEAGQTVSMQLATAAAPTNPVSALGDDLVVTNTQGRFSSGWIAVSDAMSGLTEMVVAVKGSNTTVDFAGRWVDIAFKIV